MRGGGILMKRWRRMLCGVLAGLALLCGCAGTAEDAGPDPAGLSSMEEQPEIPVNEKALTQEDWKSMRVVAHAMGAADGRFETNSLDAFLQSYAAGQRVFEVDLQFTSDGHLVARHDWDQISYYNLEQTYAEVMDWETFKATPIAFFYTPLDADDLVALMRMYPDVYLVTDSKDTGEEAVRAQIRTLDAAVRAGGDPEVWDRIVVQIYHEEMYDWVSQEAPVINWIFTLYQIADPDYEEIGRFCRSRHIPVVTMSSDRADRENCAALHDSGCLVYLHTVNRLRTMLEMAWLADGFYSDCVTQEQYKAALSGTNEMYLGELPVIE